MPSQRRDYIITQIELLGTFVSRLSRTREEAGLREAIQLAQHLQEKLFATPPAEFLRLEVSEQLALLGNGESKATAHEKSLTYARLLRETATLYQLHGREGLAAGARQLALHVALSVALDEPVAPDAVHALVDELREVVDHENLHPPVLELLETYEQL